MLEKLAYGFMSVIILVGIVLAKVDGEMFMNDYAGEDRLLEYLTVVFLFATAMLSLNRLVKTRLAKGKCFVIITGLAFLVMLFGAGEEISWGQRIFEIKSSEFFLENNRQGETNIHNMNVMGVNINKLIFGKGVSVLLFFYYLPLPYFYARKQRVQEFIDRFYLPVPKLHTGLFLLVAALAIILVDSPRKSELFEACMAIIFFLTIFQPVNKNIIYNQ